MYRFSPPMTAVYPLSGEFRSKHMESTLNASSNLALQEIIEVSEVDAFFPTIDFDGRWMGQKSQDNVALLIRRLHFESSFVDAVKRSKGLPFEIYRGINGAVVNKTFPLGNMFYALIRTPSVNVNENFSICESARVLRDIQTELGHAYVRFTYNPSNVVSQYGTCEGEMVNGLVQKLRETIKSKRYAAATKVSTALTSNWNSGFQRYLQCQIQLNPFLTCIRLELQGMPKNSSPYAVRAAEEQVQSFFEAVSADLSATVSGYWWKREYRSEIGFSHHAIVFCSDINGEQSLEMFIGELKIRWHAATQGLGRLYMHFFDPRNYRTWGIGLLRNTSDQLTQSVRRMLTCEQYLRLSSTEQIPPVGMGKLPKKSRQKMERC